MNEERADIWADRMNGSGLRANKNPIITPDTPYRVLLKIGKSKWLQFDSEKELEEALLWLVDNQTLPSPDDPVPDTYEEWERPGENPHLAHLASRFVLDRAERKSLDGIERDEKHRVRCHGCGAFHQGVTHYGDVRLCNFCENLTWELRADKNPPRVETHEYPPCEAGDIVQHRHFGRGVIIGVFPEPGDWCVTVRFFDSPKTPIKKLLWSLSGLQAPIKAQV